MEERLRICEMCSIYDVLNTICNARLWVHPETNDLSTTAKEGYVKGCGCHVPSKAKNPNKHCPAGKW